MWSQWRCDKSSVARTVPSVRSSSPSFRIPVPASRMNRVDPQRTSTQLVLPPTPAVSGPGEAMLPRTPQNLICIIPCLPPRQEPWASGMPAPSRVQMLAFQASAAAFTLCTTNKVRWMAPGYIQSNRTHYSVQMLQKNSWKQHVEAVLLRAKLPYYLAHILAQIWFLIFLCNLSPLSMADPTKPCWGGRRKAGGRDPV